MKTETIQMDRAGRVVLPKPLRDMFNLAPGDKLRLWVEGNSIRLQPEEQGIKMLRKGSVLVLTGGFNRPVTTAEVTKLIEQDREARVSPNLTKRAAK